MIDLKISEAEFLEKYWQKKPYVIRQGMNTKESFLTPDELAGLACESFVESRIVSHNPKQNQWHLEHGPFEEERFSELPESHWTLLVQGVEQFLPEAQSLLSHFAFLSNWRIDDLMVSYAAKQGSVGPHLDHYDVFLIQSFGSREWRISNRAIENEKLISDLEIKIMENFTPDEIFILEPGDILYLPPRFAHYGIALDPSITMSVGFRAPHQVELIENFFRFLAASGTKEIHLTDPNRISATMPGLFSVQDRNSLRNLVNKAVESDLFDRFVGRYMSLPKGGFEEKIPSNDDTMIGLKLEKELGTRWIFFILEENCMFYVNGHEWQLPKHFERLLDLLTSSKIIYTYDELKKVSLDLNELDILLKELIANNFLLPMDVDH